MTKGIKTPAKYTAQIEPLNKPVNIVQAFTAVPPTYLADNDNKQTTTPTIKAKVQQKIAKVTDKRLC